MHARSLSPLAVALAALLSGGAHAQSATCVSDHDCQDGSWCNGVERCEGNPGRAMCVPAPRGMCSAKKWCDETAKKCVDLSKENKTPTCPEGQAYSVADQKCVATPIK